MYLLRQDVTNLETLIQVIGVQMLANGFVLASVNGNIAASNISSSATSIVLNAGAGVDARHTTEPWSVVLKASDADGWMSINVLPTVQLSGDQPPTATIDVAATSTAAAYQYTREAGRVSVNSDQAKHFINRTSGWKLTSNDGAGNPISFYLSISDHGFSLCCWVEALSDLGTCFSYVVVQRGVLQSNLQLPTTKSPLICVFQTESDGDVQTLKPESIQRFIVIEDDISSVSDVVSAVIAQPNVFPIINPLQQSTFTPDNNVIILFPQLYNTQRHIYFLVLDMLAYTSANSVSMSSTVPIGFNVGTKNYYALIANGAANNGVRILFPMS